MQAVKVKVIRKGTKHGVENDSARLSMSLNEANNYSNEYDAIMIEIDGGACYCVRESDLKFVQAKIGEIEIRELPVV